MPCKSKSSIISKLVKDADKAYDRMNEWYKKGNDKKINEWYKKWASVIDKLRKKGIKNWVTYPRKTRKR